MSAFCTILAARASAFLKRFVKHESRQTLSRRFVCRFVCNFEDLGGKVQGTLRRPRFCRQTLSANADKRCAFCRQGSSENADKFCRRTFSRPFPPKCRQTSSKMQTRALHFRGNCRQIMQTRFVYIILGTSAFLFVYRHSKVCLQTS